MAYKVIILYQLYMPSYFLGTFTEYPFLFPIKTDVFLVVVWEKLWYNIMNLNVRFYILKTTSYSMSLILIHAQI